MSYLQLELGGKLRGLKYNTMAIIEFQKKNKSDNEMSLLYAAVWSGLITNDYVKSIETDYTFEEVCDWCDQIEDKPAIMEKVSGAIRETQEFKKLIKEPEVTEEDKKKA